MPETDFGMPGMTQIMARPPCKRIWHAGHVREFGMLGMPENLACPACRRFWHAGQAGMNYLLLERRLLASWVRRSQIMLTEHAKFCCMPISMQNHSGATPSITSEQIIDDRHGKNPCMLTNIENVAEMSSIA